MKVTFLYKRKPPEITKFGIFQDNENAHFFPETAHSAIMRIDQHRPVDGLGAFAATRASLGKIKVHRRFVTGISRKI